MVNNMGIMVVEALKTLKEPATLNTIVSTLATFLDCADKDILEAVKITLEGGVEFGYILKRGQKFAFRHVLGVSSAAKLCEWKNPYTESKNDVCNIKPSETETLRSSQNKAIMKTLYKSKKPITNSDISAENSAQCCVAKSGISRTRKLSAKSWQITMNKKEINKLTL